MISTSKWFSLFVSHPIIEIEYEWRKEVSSFYGVISYMWQLRWRSLSFHARHHNTGELEVLVHKFGEKEYCLWTSKTLLSILTLNHLNYVLSLQVLVFFVRLHHDYAASIFRDWYWLWARFFSFTIADVQDTANDEVASFIVPCVEGADSIAALRSLGLYWTEFDHRNWLIVSLVCFSNAK
jgi:hypothetical protein